jgi:hypothetical protein
LALSRGAEPGASALLAGAAFFAAAELAAGLLIGRFFVAGKAEALLFFAFRPWLLLAAAALVARLPTARRAIFYSAALALASLCETVLLLALGGGSLWSEMLRGLAAGAGLAAVADLVLQLGRRLGRRAGQAAAIGALALLFVVPQGLRPYEALLLGGAASEAETKPEVLLMTALPIVWGEGGAFDPASRPSETFRYLQREFAVRPLDAIEPGPLERGRLMLLAQPRMLAPEELVTLDGWVRGGGRILILTDPQLVWPSRWPPGDVRRPPAAGLLAPLLGHWGLRLDPPAGDSVLIEQLPGRNGARRVSLAAPGAFEAAGPACRLAGRPWLARCRIGRGEALVVADADLLHDPMWAGSGAGGSARHLRLADNPLLVADWLDALAGLRRDRVEGPVRWISPAADRTRALLLAALPLAIAFAAALTLRLAGRGRST